MDFLAKRSRVGISAALGAALFVTLAGGCGATPAASSSAPPSFAGKTVVIVNNYGAGGASDLEDRLYARYLPHYLKGSPVVIVQDRPGGSGEIGWNYVAHAAHAADLTFCSCSDPVAPVLVGDPGVKYHLDKLVWIGSVPMANILYMSTAVGSSASALLHPKVRLAYAGLGPSGGSDLIARAFFRVLNAPYRYVTGYRNIPKIKQAILSGEANISSAAVGDWVSLGLLGLQKSGKIVPIAQSGVLSANGHVVADSRSSLPTLDTVIRQQLGKAPSSSNVAYQALQLLTGYTATLRGIALPPNTPTNVANALRTAMTKMFADPGFQTAYKHLDGIPPVLVNAAQTKAVIGQVLKQFKAHPAAVKLLRAMAQNRSLR